MVDSLFDKGAIDTRVPGVAANRPRPRFFFEHATRPGLGSMKRGMTSKNVLLLRVLGGLEASWGGQRCHLRPKLGEILTLIALRGPIRRATLITLLFPAGDGPASLKRTLTELRAALRGTGVRIAGVEELSLEGPVWVDAVELERALASGADVETVLGLYCGALLPRTDSLWVESERVRLAEAVERAASKADPADAIRLLDRLLSLEPARESAALLLMETHAAREDRVAAARVYHRCRKHLARLEFAPSMALRRAFEALRSPRETAHPQGRRVRKPCA